ncbi:MAG: acyclic terpene utilization AtuA family protein [Pseudomonadota bacterium]
MTKTIRIGGAGAFYGDTSVAAPQLVEKGALDYLVMDYLAEVTMAILAKAREKSPDAGYAHDIVPTLKTILPSLAKQNIKVVTNAGGVNPIACVKAIRALISESGLDLRVAAVTGDDVTDAAADLKDENGNAVDGPLVTANAYLGAMPIVHALNQDADIIITGRCVDSALVLAPLIHEFGWDYGDYDLISSGSLAGHILECGAQATGGNFTDWQLVPDWENIGFPIAECRADGGFLITKPSNTGGIVTAGTVAEQIVYEIGDPSAYLLPDVTCDWSNVELTEVEKNVVRVSGARGRAPSAVYKVGGVQADGFRTTYLLFIGGHDAPAKARRTADAIITRVGRILKDRQLPPLDAHSIEVIGSEDTYGANAKGIDPRDVVLKISVQSSHKASVNLFIREVAAAATGMAPGISNGGQGLPRATQRMVFNSLYIDKEQVPVTLTIGDDAKAVSAFHRHEGAQNTPPLEQRRTGHADMRDLVRVPLRALAYGRSGDKGDHANIGIIARNADFYPYIDAALTEDSVTQFMVHTGTTKVEKYYLPGFFAINFLLRNALGGGGTGSLRMDPQGKAFAQQLLDFDVQVPADLCKRYSLTTIAS